MTRKTAGVMASIIIIAGLAGCSAASSNVVTPPPVAGSQPASTPPPAQVSPVTILEKVKGVVIGNTAPSEDIQGVPYSTGTLGGQYGDTVTVWTGTSPAAIIAEQGGTEFLETASPTTYVDGKDFILQYVLPIETPAVPVVPLKTVAAETGGHVVQTP